MIRIDAEVEDMDLIDLNDTLPVLEQEVEQWRLFSGGSKDEKSVTLAGKKVFELNIKIKAISHKLRLLKWKGVFKPEQIMEPQTINIIAPEPLAKFYYIARKKPSKKGFVKWYSEEKPYKPWVTDISQAMPLKEDQLQNFKVGQVYWPAEYIDSFNTSVKNKVSPGLLDKTKAGMVQLF